MGGAHPPASRKPRHKKVVMGFMLSVGEGKTTRRLHNNNHHEDRHGGAHIFLRPTGCEAVMQYNNQRNSGKAY